MSCVYDFTTPLLVSQSYLRVKTTNVTVKSSIGVVLRPLAVWTLLMTVVSRLRLSMSAHPERNLLGPGSTLPASHLFLWRGVALMVQPSTGSHYAVRNICHKRTTASKGTIFSNWQNSCRAVSNNGGLSAQRLFVSWERWSEHKRSLGGTGSHTILIHLLLVLHIHMHMTGDLWFSNFCFVNHYY